MTMGKTLLMAVALVGLWAGGAEAANSRQACQPDPRSADGKVIDPGSCALYRLDKLDRRLWLLESEDQSSLSERIDGVVKRLDDLERKQDKRGWEAMVRSDGSGRAVEREQLKSELDGLRKQISEIADRQRQASSSSGSNSEISGLRSSISSMQDSIRSLQNSVQGLSSKVK